MGFIKVKYITSDLNKLNLTLEKLKKNYNLGIKIINIKVAASDKIVLLRAPKVNKNSREKFFKKTFIVYTKFIYNRYPKNLKFNSNKSSITEIV